MISYCSRIVHSVKKFINDGLSSNGMEVEKKRWRVPSLLWLPLIVCAVILFGIADIFQFHYNMSPISFRSEHLLNESNSILGFLVKTSGCRIPYMDPFDAAIKKYIIKEKQPICNNGVPALFDSNLTSIFLVKTSLENYEIQDIDTLKCCYRAFYRKQPNNKDKDEKIAYSKECIYFKESAVIADEFIKVICNVNDITIYTDFFSFVPLKTTANNLQPKSFLNVLIVGIDAVSRLNMHRQMPKTVDYLLDNIKAVEFYGYNKVGDNTFPNLIPVLTGLSEEELRKVCWANANQRFDDCPFIWKNFKKFGFLTSFGEDSSWMGLFNYVKKGFKKQPTDYMWGVFNIVEENEIGNSHNMNVQECVGARETYKVFLAYIKKFVTKMDTSKVPYFAMYWSTNLSHDLLNKPKLGDEDFYNLFRFLNEDGHLNNTVMIVMSDHGIRWGGIRQTYQGRMEERLPFLFMVLPEWYKRQYSVAYYNLLKNTRRLSTPFDLHETLQDLIMPFNLTSYYVQKRGDNTKSRAFSLFTEINPKRTCEDAGIESHWCTCQQSESVSRNNTIVKQVVNFVVNRMNDMLAGYLQCSRLSLSKTLNSQVMTHPNHILNGDTVKDYMVTFETIPGNGIFEVTVRTVLRRDKTYHHEIMGTISRLNLYGKQSACITDFHLKLYCYCETFL